MFLCCCGLLHQLIYKLTKGLAMIINTIYLSIREQNNFAESETIQPIIKILIARYSVASLMRHKTAGKVSFCHCVKKYYCFLFNKGLVDCFDLQLILIFRINQLLKIIFFLLKLNQKLISILCQLCYKFDMEKKHKY